MDNKIVYNINATDNLSAVLEKLHGKASQLTESMGGMKNILGTLGVGFAVFQGLNFVKGGIEKVERLNQSIAQVQAGLESTNGAAGMTMDSIKNMASEMSSRMKFGKADIIDMQAQMLTFGGITKENFPAIGDAIANVASKIGMDLHGMSIQFGKAMENPSEGVKKLSRQGVIFSKEQTDQIDKLVAKGETVKAQQIMLTEIQSKYGGASLAAFNADPLARFSKMMGKFQEAIGEAALSVLDYLMPALEGIASLFKTVGGYIMSTISFIKEYKNVFESIVISVAIVGGAYLIYLGYLKAMEFWGMLQATATLANAVANGTLTVTTVLLNSAMMALNESFLANPAFWMIIGIVALIAAFVYLYKNVDEFRAFFIATWEGLKTSFATIIEGMMLPIKLLIASLKAVWAALHGDMAGAKTAFEAGFQDFIEAGKKTANAFKKGYDGEMTKSNIHNKFMEQQEATVAKINELVAKNKISDQAYTNAVANLKNKMDLGVKGKTISEDEKGDVLKKLKGKALTPISAGGGGDGGTDKPSSVSGSKVVTINVSIGNLINDFQIKTTNIHESTTAIKDKVVQALTGAIIESQLLAGQ